MQKKEYFLKLPIAKPEIQNVLQYLKKQAQFEVEYRGSSFIFHVQDNINFFELYKLADSTKINPATFKELLSEYSGLKIENTSEICKEAVSVIKNIKNETLQQDNFSQLILFIDTYKSLIFSYQDLVPYLLKEELIPLFFSFFPEGEIYLLRKNMLLEKRFAVLRALPLISHGKFMDKVSGEKFPGFETLKDFNMPSIHEIDYFLNPLFLFFKNYIFGFSCSSGINQPLNKVQTNNLKDEFTFLFFFGKNIDWLPRASYVQKAYEIKTPDGNVVKKAHIPHIPKDIPWGIESFFKPRGSIPLKILTYDKINFNSTNYFELFQYWVEKLNFLFNHLASPVNFIDGSQINAEEQFLTALTVDRIFKETTLIQTEMRHKFHSTPFTAFNLSCGILDKIATLMTTSDKQNSDSKNFKYLLRKSVISPSMKEVFDEMPKPFNNYFRNQFKSTFEELENTIKDSIFLDIFTTPQKDVIEIAGQKIPFEEYVSEFLRTIRNTNHGYRLKRPGLHKIEQFEYLRFSSGKGLMNIFPELAKFYLIWMSSKIKNLKL